MDAADPVPPALQETIAPSQWESANKDGAARGQDRGRATPTGAARDRSWDKTERPDTGPALRTTDSTALPGGSRGSLASPDDDAHLPGPGARIAHYELIRELGRGGMGVVFLARDTRLARRVAIKFLRTDSPDMTQRFLVEARATARCHHENIVVIHDIADHDGMPFMVLEYLHGQNLDKLMREEPLAPLRAIEIMIPVARALSRAHEHGIVHRDLKPANIFVGESGTIKVLDFGIAKLLAEQGESALPARFEPLDGHGPPPTAGFAGTLPYMAPEQLNNEDIDHRADIWAAGIILYELMHGHHPMAPISYTVLLSIGIADEPMPSAHRDGQGEHPLHRSLAELIDHCLIKDRSRRLASASELAERLEELLPRNQRQRLNEDECPYPGLLSFSESDADRFFGRSDDVTQVVARLRKQPLLGVTGPTGSGKSSFVNAGVIPALRGSGDSWHILKVRPGRAPLAALASAMAPLTTLGDQPSDDPLREQRELSQRLRREPGYLGAALRRRADRTGGRILLVVDPLEELYTLTGDPDHRLAFTTALAGAADDVSSPVRVILATRSDFLDRVAEDRYLMHELAGNLIFLGPPERDALEEALIGPADLAGYRFESNDLVATIIAEVEATPSSLPLLQFAASKLWETRDRRSKQLTAASYHHIGGLIGALTSHANQVVAEIFQLSAGAPRVTRALFQRLVTPERTRAITPIAELSAELEPLCSDPDEVAQIIDRLVSARLLVAHGGGEHSGEDGSAGSGPTVELIHD
ncbi:MAG: serine/threonine-protein kinase, partial [Myxococcota bacterium]